jgi:membrane protein required for colicin V production
MMSLLDLALLIPIVIGIIKGYRHGFMNEVASIVAVALGYTFSNLFGEILTSWFINSLSWNKDISIVVANVLIFGVVSIVLYFIARKMTNVAKGLSLAWANRLLGACLGGIKWGLIVLIFVMCLHRLDNSFHFLSDELKENSTLYMKGAPLAEKLWDEAKSHVNEDGSIDVSK